MGSTEPNPTRVHNDVHVTTKVAADEQAPSRMSWDEESEARLEALDLAAERGAAGHPVVTLDGHGRVVLHHPDGSAELR